MEQTQSITPTITLDENDQKKVLDAVKKGMPWKMIARFIKISLADLAEFHRDNDKFALEVREAEASCMKELLDKLDGASQWQAITFILESRWPEHFGRNRLRKKKRKFEPDPTEEMLDALSPEEFLQYRSFVDKMHAAYKAARARKTLNRSVCGPDDPPRLCGPGVAGT